MDAPRVYPVRVAVPYAERLSRGLIFVKWWLLAIPHLLILRVLGYALGVTWLISLFAILFTGKYPQGLFKFNVGVRRWHVNVSTYQWLMRDEYPPFSMDAGDYPAVLEVDYPQHLNRWLVLVKWLLIIPHVLVLAVLTFVAILAWIAAWFAILFTGVYPEGLHRFIVGRLRWNERVWLYVLMVTDEYPPFSLD
jgi:hypothetical protein